MSSQIYLGNAIARYGSMTRPERELADRQMTNLLKLDIQWEPAIVMMMTMRRHAVLMRIFTTSLCL